MPKRSAAFDVKLSAEQRGQIADDLCRAVADAFDARSEMIKDGGTIDYLDWYYEQGRSAANDRPFPGAADLTSPFITETIDSMRARIIRTVFGVEPFCVVDAWGPDAAKAPAVEAFHQWQVYETGLLPELTKVAHGALIEGGYIIEVRERVETSRRVEELDVALQLHEETGGPVMGPDGPLLQTDPDGEYVKATADQPAASIKRDYMETRRLGPEYEAISLKDFVFLPGHALNRRQVWGYAKRVFMRVPDLQARAKDGVYDKAAVELVGTSSDREVAAAPVSADVAPQEGPAVEKELFELSIKRDFDEDGREEWYVATIHLQSRTLLRLQLDKLVMKIGKPRCVPFILCPRRNSVYGYSYAEKVLTLAEEHTSQRNMKADRSALVTNAPIMRRQGSMWDPETQPFGVGGVIDVRDHGDLQQMVIADVPASIVEQEQGLWGYKERVSGLSDMANGVQANQARTLGENQMVQQGSAVRVEELIDHFRLAISDVMEISHAIWLEALRGNKRPMVAPASVAQGLGDSFSGQFTADMLDGQFRFKPYGSVDTANTQGQLQAFNGSLQALGQLAQMFPQVVPILQASPDIMKAVFQEWARVFKVRNANVFLKALTAPPQVPIMPGAGGDAGAPEQVPQGMPPGGGMPDLSALLQMANGGGGVQ